MKFLRHSIIYLFALFIFCATSAATETKVILQKPPSTTLQSVIIKYPPIIYSHATNRAPNRGTLNSQLTINGKDFYYRSFQVRMETVVYSKSGPMTSSTQLEIISRSSTRIIARLPGKRMTGKLIAGYGSPGNEKILSDKFIVHGDPQISRISTASFLKGSQVTLSGVDLYDVEPYYIYYHDQTSEKMIGIGNNQNLLVVNNWSVQADKVQFTIPVSCPYYCQYGATQDPARYVPHQDAARSGNLLVRKRGGAELNTGIVVSYSPQNLADATPLSITRAQAPRWGNQPVSFVFGARTCCFNQIDITGYGLKDARAFLNGLLLKSSFSSDGKSGKAWIAYNAYSGAVSLVKDKASGRQTAQTPRFTVVPKPTLTTPPPFQQQSTFTGVPVNREFSIKGYDLAHPSTVPGLTYKWKLGIADRLYYLKVIRANSREVIIKIVPRSALPVYYFDRSRHQNSIIFTASYNGQEKQLDWYRIYLIK